MVTPIRELALQIGKNFKVYAKYTNSTQATILVVFFKEQGRKGAASSIGTPVRLFIGFIEIKVLNHFKCKCNFFSDF